MLCPNCNSNNAENANFCQNCGTALQKVEQKKVSKTQKSAKKKINNTKSNSYLVLTLAFVFALVIIFAIYENNRSSLEKKISQSSSGRSPQVENQSPQAQAMMQKVLDLRNALDADPDNYDLNVQMANNNFDIGRYDQALKYYKKAISLNNKNANVLIDMGVSYFNLNAMDSALIYMKQALDLQPNHPQGLYNTGIVYYNLGDFDNALKNWEKLIQNHSDSREAQSAIQFVEQLKKQTGKS